MPPFRFTAKPKSRENTIRGSMARRVSRPLKSLAVKKFTIMSGSVAYSPISWEARLVQAAGTGGKTTISTYMMTAAMAPVTTKVPTVTPMIFPARFRLSMLATALEMEAKTMGTTTQNIMLMNTVPRGLSTVAPVPETMPPLPSGSAGQTQPRMAPKIMAPSIMAKKA